MTAPTITRSDHATRDGHASTVAAGTDFPADHTCADAHTGSVGGEHDSDNGQPSSDTQRSTAVVAPSSTTPASDLPTSNVGAPGVADPQTGSAEPGQKGDAPRGHSPLAALADPTLRLLAEILDDLERTRIANENRLRQLTRSETDSDGEDRGFGLTIEHPSVARVVGIVQAMKCDSTVGIELTGEKRGKKVGCCLEHDSERSLSASLRMNPLSAWIKVQKGVGEKQAARLLAAIGDPYWRPEMSYEDGTTVPARPRTVSELWAYCGLHTLPVGQRPGVARTPVADGVNVAARRRKGERANWSAAAKMRAWNIAGSMLKAGNRETYDKRKAATEGRVHATECVRCGPSGKPAQSGSAWSDGHRHADALRIVSKELLKQLWREAKRIHEERA